MAERIARQISIREAIDTKTMWAGSHQPMPMASYELTDGKFEPTEHTCAPALYKAIDEVVVNAIDQSIYYSGKVKRIDIKLGADGTLEIKNDGPGIPLTKVVSERGVEMYMPQLVATEFLAGDNLDVSENIKGGTNGLGLKIAGVYSEWLVLKTISGGILYEQRNHDALRKVDAPTLTECKDIPYTSIKFLLRYKKFGISFKNLKPTLDKMMVLRAWQAAAYSTAAVYYNGKKIPIKSFGGYCEMFTSEPIYMTNMTSPNSEHEWEVGFALSSDSKAQSVSIVNGINVRHGGSHIKYIQKKLVDRIKPIVEKELKSLGATFKAPVITNNLVIFMKGAIPSPSFDSQTKERITDAPKKYAGYDLSVKDVRAVWELLRDTVNGIFMQKQLAPSKGKADRSRMFVRKYTEAHNCTPKLWKQCSLIITEGDSATSTADTGLRVNADPSFNPDWYGVYSVQGVVMNGLKEGNPLPGTGTVSKSGSKSGSGSTMSIISDDENDSDRGDEEKSKSSPKPERKPKRRYKPGKGKGMSIISDSDNDSDGDGDDGDFDTDEIVEIKDSVITARPRHIPNKKLLANERLAGLVKILGLDYNKRYAMDPAGDKEFNTLRYASVICLMDQDHDGFNIAGLIVTFFVSYWPWLVKRGFVKRIKTPIIRIYPKAAHKHLKIEKFYSLSAASEWIANNRDSENADKYLKPKYYKGLGTHDKKKGEVKDMFKDIESVISTYVLDPDAFDSIHCFYGNDPNTRKAVLVTPVESECGIGPQVGVSEFVKTSVKGYQKDNLLRKLPNIQDGLVQGRRKILFGALENGHGEVKVSSMAGQVSKIADYDHGDAAMSKAITRLAQPHRNLPLMSPSGSFGTRKQGYTDAAGPRYIFTSINWRLVNKLFRKEDEYILKYDTSRGDRYEPEYYCGIIPFVLCENESVPATGWNVTLHARHIDDIFENTRAMIRGERKECGKLRLWKRGFRGKIMTHKKKAYYVGVYEYNETANTIHVTELPPGTYSDLWVYGNKEEQERRSGKKTKTIGTDRSVFSKKYVASVRDDTTDEGTNITITLEEGAVEALYASNYGNETFDPIVDYFGLKEAIHSKINLIDDKGKVVEYGSYKAVFNDWFATRKIMYGTRVDRELIIAKYKLVVLENMQRFSREHSVIKVGNSTPEEVFVRKLTEHKYTKLNVSLLNNPRYTEVDVLEKEITEISVSYDYIMGMAYRDLTTQAYKKRTAEIEKLRERILILQDPTAKFKGSSIWLTELDELEAVIKKGLATDWTYGQHDGYVF